MLENIDCMYWPWANCPNAWRGQFYRGDQGHPTIILEAAASQDLWLWHAFFGVPGSNNDINVINQSLVFEDVVKGTGPNTRFTVSGVEYMRRYYLADGIYPTYSTVQHPPMKKERNLLGIKNRRERTLNEYLGFYKARWHIILEDEGRVICEYNENAMDENTIPVSPEQQELNEFSLRNEHIHHHLQADLIEYIWNNGRDD